jgi:hypothetical protein
MKLIVNDGDVSLDIQGSPGKVYTYWKLLSENLDLELELTGSAEEITLFLEANQKQGFHLTPSNGAEKPMHLPLPADDDTDIDPVHSESILRLLQGNEVAFINPEGSTAKQVLENLLQKYPSDTELALDKKLQSVVRKYLSDCQGVGQKRCTNGQIKYILGGN